MSRKYWRFSSYDKKQSAELAYTYGYDEFAVLLLNSRGVDNPEDIAEFLDGDTEFSSPFLIKDMDKAVNRIKRAVDAQEKIAVYGDYDADGVTATALLYSYLETIGADVTYYIPSRIEEGYGLNKDAVDKLCGEGVQLIITVDNGINSVSEAEYINSRGVGLVITDHHRPGKVMPLAEAVVNPHREDDTSPFKDLAGVGVAFKLAAALEDGDCETIIDSYADIIAIGTIADIVPMKGENRMIAVRGVEAVNNSDRPGIIALKSGAGYKDRDITASGLAFSIAPRINAAGRIESAVTALRLLLTEDIDEAVSLAEKLDGFNALRQETEAGIVDEVIERIENDEKLKYSRVIVAEGENWHAGVIGIVASKLVDRYGKPAMVIAKDSSGEAKGSCRSIDGFSLFDALSASSDVLERFGGHTLAAGFSVKDENIDLFRNKINEYADKLPVFYPVLNLDCRLNPASINMDLIDSLTLLEPFGAENPQPVFGLCKVTLCSVKPLGAAGKHIKLCFEKGGAQFSAVYFGMSADAFPYEAGDVIDIAVTVDKNEFRGEIKAGIYVKDVKLSSFDDDKYFASEALYEKARGGGILSEKERAFVCPDRAFCASVFRFIKKRGSCCADAEIISVKLGFGSERTCRVRIALDAFCELGLINCNNGVYKVSGNSEKVSLGSSVILKNLGYRE